MAKVNKFVLFIFELCFQCDLKEKEKFK